MMISITSFSVMMPAVPPNSSITIAIGFFDLRKVTNRSSSVTASGTNNASSISPVIVSITPSIASGVRLYTGR